MLSKHPLRAGLEFMLVFGSQAELVKASKWVRVKQTISFKCIVNITKLQLV